MNRFLFPLCVLAASLALAGCSSSKEAAPTSADVKNFQGGPMTPAQIAEQDKKRQQVMQQSKQKPPAAALR